MERSKNAFRWPFREDRIWVNSKDILYKHDNPVTCGNFKRTFKITESDMEATEMKVKAM